MSVHLCARPSRGQVRSVKLQMRIYVIYDADILGSSREIESMGPFREATRDAPYARPMPGQWVETEGDEQYDFGYLGNESGDVRYFPAGAFDSEGIETVDTIDADDPRADSEDFGEGRHRKWVADLSMDEWCEVADMLCIDLDGSGIPERYEETMGSITEYGHIPAVSVSNHEGWSPMEVIWSSLYLSFYTIAGD